MAILLQILLIDDVIVPELAKVFKEIETNGTALDGDLDMIGDRLTSLESLLNVTI